MIQLFRKHRNLRTIIFKATFANENSLQNIISYLIGKYIFLSELFINIYLLKYTEASGRPICVFPRFEACTGDYFFMTIRTCNVNWNIFERSFSVGRFGAICPSSCWLRRFLAFTSFLRDQVYSFLVRHFLNQFRETKKIASRWKIPFTDTDVKKFY